MKYHVQAWMLVISIVLSIFTLAMFVYPFIGRL